MDRQTFYAYEAPLETDFLYGERFAYEGLGLLAMDLLGTTALVAGLGCVPTGPASLQVKIQPGRLYSVQNLEPSAWGLFNAVGGLPLDTNADHNILKQGVYRDTTTLATMAAPGTAGQSINYLIEAAFSEADANPLSIAFVSSTAPYAPVAPNTLNTQRQDQVVITVKAGTPAATGTQTTPSVDAGNVGLYVVTVANGQSTITSGNISIYPGAPFITETLTQKISQTTGDARYLRPGVNARTQLTGATSFYVTATGNDSTGTGAVGAPWLTVQHAINALLLSYDFNGFQVTINVGAGTFAGANIYGQGTGQEGLSLIISGAGAGTTFINSTITGAYGCYATLQSMTISSSSSIPVSATEFGRITIGSGVNLSGAGAGTPLVRAQLSSLVQLASNLTISGGGSAAFDAESGSTIFSNSVTVTITGTPAFTAGFVVAAKCGTIDLGNLTFSGSATGPRYFGNLNGVINSQGGGANFFPGNSAGSSNAGSQYA